MKNPDSTSGMAEDLIRSIVQMGASEMHLKTLYEKTLAEMENGIVDVEEPDAVNAHIDKLKDYEEDLITTAQLRRRMMRKLFDFFDGDKDAWCMVKHLGIASETAFETWQASDNDPELMQISVDTNKAFIRALTRFLGMEITECASCFSDFLKAEGNDENTTEEI